MINETGLQDNSKKPITDAPASALAVLGHPISHSQSPLIHTAAYQKLGLPWSYTAQECREPDLSTLLHTAPDQWRGFSVTMPLKTTAFELAAVHDQIAVESGVVNTLLRILDVGGTPTWAGFNTDVAGLAAAIRLSKLNAEHVVVLGAGATAVSAVLAARELGATQIDVLARNEQAAVTLADQFNGTGSQHVQVHGSELAQHTGALASATLVISTLPGSAGENVELPSWVTQIPLFDVAYDPWPSPLAKRWEAQGGTSTAGHAMLVQQALLQIRIFVNGDPSLPVENEESVLKTMNAALQNGQ